MTQTQKPTAIFIVGPTASGKTALAVELALLLDTQVISADAIAVYDRLEIGSARSTPLECKGVTHHLLGEIPLGETFSAARFKEIASQRMDAIFAMGRIPIIAGGTGLYVHALLHPLDAGTAADEAFREEARRREAESPGVLHRELQMCDAIAAGRIHPNDTKRIIRALEIANAGGMGEYDFRREHPLNFTPLIFGLNMPREQLYNRLDARFDAMMNAGLLEETRAIAKDGYDHDLAGLNGLGYRQLLAHIRGECSLEEAIETAKRETRRFAKRQITWFKRENVTWLEANIGAKELAQAVAKEISDSSKN